MMKSSLSTRTADTTAFSTAEEEEEDEANNNSLFTTLSVCQTVTRSCRLFIQHAALFFSLAAVFVLPIVFLVCIAVGTYAPTANKQQPLFIVAIVAVILAYLPFAIVVQAAMVRAVAEIYAMGEQQQQQQQAVLSRCKEYLRTGLGKFGPILCYVAILILGTFVAAAFFLICVSAVVILLSLVLGQSDIGTSVSNAFMFFSQIAFNFANVYITLGLFVVVPCIVAEDGVGWYRGIQRSWDLVSNRRLFVFGAQLLYNLAILVPFVPYFVIIISLVSLSSVLRVLLLALPFLILVPLGAIFPTVIYLHLRVDKEGCVQSVLVRDLGLRSPEDSQGEKYTPLAIATAEIISDTNHMEFGRKNGGIQVADIV